MLADGSQSRLIIARQNLNDTAKAVDATVKETRDLSNAIDDFSRGINEQAGHKRTEILSNIAADNSSALIELMGVAAGSPST